MAFTDMRTLRDGDLVQVSRLGDFDWWESVGSLSGFPELPLRDDVKETLARSCYISSLEEGLEYARVVDGLDVGDTPFLRTRLRQGHIFHRQYPLAFGRRGTIAVKRLKTAGIGNQAFDPIDYTTADINSYINRRIERSDDKFVFYVARDQLGFNHLYIDDAAALSNILGVRRLIGEIVDIRQMSKIQIHDISVCAPSIMGDLTGGRHIGMVACGDNPYAGPGENLVVCVANSPFMGWKKKLGNCATLGMFAHKKGFHILHAAVYYCPVTGRVILILAVGSGGKTEMGLGGPEVLAFDGETGQQIYNMSDLGRNMLIKISDDLTIARERGGHLYACNGENGVLHRPEMVDDPYVAECLARQHLILADNFEHVEGEGIDFMSMMCLDGQKSDNSRIVFDNEQLPQGSYFPNSVDNMIRVTDVVLGGIFPPAWDVDKKQVRPGVVNQHPILALNKTQFGRAACASPRIKTQSLVVDGDPLALSDEGPLTIVNFIIQSPEEVLQEQLEMFFRLDDEETFFWGLRQRHACGFVAEKFYHFGYMFRCLLLQGILDDAELQPDPTHRLSFIPKFKPEDGVPEFMQVPPDAMADGYNAELELTLRGVERLEAAHYWSGFRSLRCMGDQAPPYRGPRELPKYDIS